jgi:oligopeptide/dipeptide ABC transporter ATP-binding protein
MTDLLEVKDLSTCFKLNEGIVPVVDGVSFTVKKGEVVGIVGESGCGKSITALSIMRLTSGIIRTGSILLDGDDLLKKTEVEMRKIRGNRISMIFQDPMTSLNPVFTVGNQLSEVLRLHQGMNKVQAYETEIELLKLVEIPNPEERLKMYPHQLSGGMRQRIMIAMALSCKPDLLIADEPTTALDVTIQAQILDLMLNLQKEKSTAIIMITHDLSVIAEMADKVMIMYAGKVVEQADTISLFDNPKHPYTQGLLASLPSITEEKERLEVIKGTVPSPTNFPSGCRFNPRCKFCKDICREQEPPKKKIAANHFAYCWLF